MEKEFKAFVGVLKEAKRRKFIRDFALTGALALSVHTQPRATADMDFLAAVEAEKIPFFVDWLRDSKGYNLARHHVGRPKDNIKNLIEVPAGGASADIIIAGNAVEEEALAEGVDVKAFKTAIKVVSAEYLMVLKLRAGSDQDYIDAAHLWNEDIDRRLVRRLTKGLYMERRLKRAVALARRLRDAG
ncbi:MAG: hypothetical protein HY894_00130 [Deltaproteobacteria bacterium]|nr:hypothetical protein [Deltaproteobacteria bacterium]